MCDILFLETNDNLSEYDQGERDFPVKQTLIGYDPSLKKGSNETILRQVCLESIDQDNSLTALAIERTVFIENIYQSNMFNELIDGPLFTEEQKEDWNNFSDLNMLAVPLKSQDESEEEPKQVRGILRVFTTSKILHSDIE